MRANGRLTLTLLPNYQACFNAFREVSVLSVQNVSANSGYTSNIRLSCCGFNTATFLIWKYGWYFESGGDILG